MSEEIQQGHTEADKALLNALYEPFGVQTTEQKLHVLTTRSGPSNFYVTGGELTDEMKLGCLEYEYLSLQRP